MATAEEVPTGPASSGMLSNLLRRIAEDHVQKTQGFAPESHSSPSPQQRATQSPADSDDSQASVRDHRQSGAESDNSSKHVSPRVHVKPPERNGSDTEPHILLSLLQEPYTKVQVASETKQGTSQPKWDSSASDEHSSHNGRKEDVQPPKEAAEEDDTSKSFLLNLLTQGAYVQPGIASISPENSPAAIPVSAAYPADKRYELPVYNRLTSDARGYDDVLKHAKQMMQLAPENTDQAFHIVITPQNDDDNDESGVQVKQEGEQDEYTPEQSDSNGFMETESNDKLTESSRSSENGDESKHSTPCPPTVVALFKSKNAPADEAFTELQYQPVNQNSGGVAPSRGEDADFVQGYICKHCGAVHMTLNELKKHVANAHRAEREGEVCHPLDLSTERDSDSSKKSTKEEKPQRDVQMCCVCGKLDMTPEGRKVILKNTFKLSNKFYQKLAWVLGTPVSHMNKNFTKICLICLRKVKKVYFAQRIHKLLKQKFEVTKQKFASHEEKKSDTKKPRKQPEKSSEGASKKGGDRQTSLSTLGQAYDMMIQQAMEAEEVIPTKAQSTRPQSSREKSNKIGALKSLLAATDVDNGSAADRDGTATTQKPTKPPAQEHCALKALLTGPALSETEPKMARSPLNAIQQKHTLEPPYEEISPSKRPRRSCRDRRSTKANLSDAEAEELMDPTYRPKNLQMNRSRERECAASNHQDQQHLERLHDSQLRQTLGTIVKQEPSSPTPVAEVPHDVFGSLLSAALGGSPGQTSATADGRVKIVKDYHVEFPGVMPGDLTEYRCIECNQQFYTKEGLDIHLRCHIEGSSELRCWECGYYNEKLPTQWRIIRSHLVDSHNVFPHLFGQHPCPVPRCSALFHQEGELFNHFATAHSNPANAMFEEPRPISRGRHSLSTNGMFDFSCSICGTSLQSEDAMALHQQCHVKNSKGYKCFLCQYSHPSQPGSWRFMRGHLFKQHMPDRISPEVFQYFECQRYSCRLRFVNINARMIHESCHAEGNDNAYYCYLCSYGSVGRELSWEMIRDHLIHHHPLVFSDRFQCNCGDIFGSYDDFAAHERANN